MILQSLNELYYRLLDDPDAGIAMPGYSPVNVSYAIVLNKTGELIDIHPLFRQQGKKIVPIEMMVPERAKRASGVNANLLCDNVSYVLGFSKNKDKTGFIITKSKFDAFQYANLKLLEGIYGNRAESAVQFLKKWDPDMGINHPAIQRSIEGLTDGGNLVFKLDGDPIFLHNDKDVKT